MPKVTLELPDNVSSLPEKEKHTVIIEAYKKQEEKHESLDDSGMQLGLTIQKMDPKQHSTLLHQIWKHEQESEDLNDDFRPFSDIGDTIKFAKGLRKESWRATS